MATIWTVYTADVGAQSDTYVVTATKWTDQGPGREKVVSEFDGADEATAYAKEQQGIYDRLRNAMDEVHQ